MGNIATGFRAQDQSQAQSQSNERASQPARRERMLAAASLCSVFVIG